MRNRASFIRFILPFEESIAFCAAELSPTLRAFKFPHTNHVRLVEEYLSGYPPNPPSTMSFFAVSSPLRPFFFAGNKRGVSIDR